MQVTKQFVVAGNAIFTIECPDGRHYTFEVQRKEASMNWPEIWFVRLLTGPCNTSDYTYFGVLEGSQVRTTKKSAKFEGTFPHQLVNRILNRVWNNEHAAFEQHGYKLHHEGMCGRCGRTLTVPESVESGFGPECSKILGIA